MNTLYIDNFNKFSGELLLDIPIRLRGFPDGTVVKNQPAMQEKQETQVQSLSQEDPHE